MSSRVTVATCSILNLHLDRTWPAFPQLGKTSIQLRLGGRRRTWRKPPIVQAELKCCCSNLDKWYGITDFLRVHWWMPSDQIHFTQEGSLRFNWCTTLIDLTLCRINEFVTSNVESAGIAKGLPRKVANF